MDPSTDASSVGPYKATKMWNDVISAFRQYMPIGRHRRYMKTFDNCFSGSGGAEWLLQYLKSHESFGSDVSRKKALLLLNKLYKSGIFEEVQLSRNMRNKPEVQENRLYRFLPMSPSKIKIPRIPLAPRNDSGVNQSEKKVIPPVSFGSKQTEGNGKSENSGLKFPSKLARKISFKRDRPFKFDSHPVESSPPLYHVMKRVLTSREIKDTWKSVYLDELASTLSPCDVTQLLQEDQVDGYSLMHNCLYLNKSGMVTNLQPDDQLPHWVLSAMKCLARWPEPPEPGLPSYPGFEKDVFTVVKDYFLGLEEPLVPYTLYHLVTQVFVMSCEPTGGLRVDGCDDLNNEHQYGEDGDEEEEGSGTVPSLWTSASLENIILNLTRKYLDDPDRDTVNSAFSLCDLRRSESVQRLRFDPQEDLRFAGLGDGSTAYDLSTFPSTDGMDRLSHSQHKPLHPHQSAGPALLSRTTQSAGDAEFNHRPKILSKVGRQFDSTPNLKVSRYETAFGPDNKTVTKVYFQKAVSSERLSQAAAREEVDSCSSRYETCFSPGLNASYSGSNHGSCDESRSCDSLLRAKARGSTLGRSKSFVDAEPNKSRKSHHHDNFLQAPKNYGMPTRTFHQEKNQGSSACYDSTESLASYRKFRNFSDSSSVSRENDKNISMNMATYQHNPPRSYNSVQESSRQSSARLPCDPSPPSLEVNSPLSDILEDVPSFGPGYRPVLDRSKHQAKIHSEAHRPLSSGDAGSLNQSSANRQSHRHSYTQHTSYTQHSNDSQHTSYIQHSSDPLHTSYTREARVTSTPLCAQYHQPVRNRRLASALEDITPLVGTRGRQIHSPGPRVSPHRATPALQMSLLLLPPASRRRLHTLCKMCVKMKSNPNLCLDPTQSMADLLLATFHRAVLRPLCEMEFDEGLVRHCVTFIMDTYEEILAPPAELKVKVSDQLKLLQKPQPASLFSLLLDGLCTKASDKVLSASQRSGV